MKKYFIIYSSLFILFICKQDVFAQPTARPALTAADYEKMIEKYDGLFRNHRKTDGIQIGPRQLAVFADMQNKYQGKQMALVYARYLKKMPPVNGKKRRVTLLLKILVTQKGAGSVNQEDIYEYIDLGGEDLCPPPEDCFPRN